MADNHEFKEAASKRHLGYAVAVFVGIAMLAPVLRVVQIVTGA